MTSDDSSAPRSALFLCIFFPMVSETFIFDQMAALRSAGIDIRILSMWRSRNDTVQETVVQHRLMDFASFAARARGGLGLAMRHIVHTAYALTRDEALAKLPREPWLVSDMPYSRSFLRRITR